MKANVLQACLAIAITTTLAAAGAQAQTANTLKTGAAPTGITVTNASGGPVYANLVLGQPPTTLPASCSNLGTQITAINDARLAFSSSVAGKTVNFTLVPDVTDKGSYAMAAGETITYTPQTFACGSAQCSAAVTFNFFFTPTDVGFKDNNGCSNSTFPNATNLAEASINFGANGSVGTGCANADDTDISAVNGVNAILKVSTQGANGKALPGWPAATSLAQNGLLGSNANKPGVFGWAATNCNGAQANAGYPNPSSSCAAPQKAPVADAKTATCKTPGGLSYAPIGLAGGTQYCDERSDAGTCNNQRQGYVTGGTVQITYLKPAY
jgi:hypothetical protein